MIIKKPYAFMIKHFRTIHVILTILVMYLISKTHAIFTFFNDYANNGYYTYSNNLTGKYINFYMFASIIFIILISAFVYLLMRWKKKSRVLYVSMVVFYFALFIGYLVYFNALNNLAFTELNVRSVRAYRDIILMLYAPQYVFLIFGIIRSIGFDIKKFDFKKDLEDLDIAEEDAEEIEVTLGSNDYKVKRFIRKTIREFKYYVVENKFFFSIICSVVVLVIGFLVYLNVSVYSKTYYQDDTFNVDGVNFKVNSSYITDVDLSGKVIRSDMRYVVIKVELKNTNQNRTALQAKDIKLSLDSNDYYPIYSYVNSFLDMGEGYVKDSVLYPNETYNYLLVYEVPADLTYSSSKLRLMQDVNVEKGEIKASYKNVVLDIKEMLNTKESKSYSIGEAISLEETTLNKSEVLVNSFELGDTFKENYTYTIGGKTYNGVKMIDASLLNRGSRTIMKLNMEVTLDDGLYINKYIKSNSDFISYFAKINYIYEGVQKSVDVTMADVGKVKTNNVYIEVPSELKHSTNINLVLNIRNKEIVINLY